MSWLLSCLRVPAATAPLLEPNLSASSDPLNGQQTSARPRASASIEQTLKNDKTLETSKRLIQAIRGVFTKLGNVSCDYSSYCRISVLLETCRSELGAYDVRLACFSTDGATWVFLPSQALETDAAPAVAGWGYSNVYRILDEKQDSVAVILGYHAASLRQLQPQPARVIPCPPLTSDVRPRALSTSATSHITPSISMAAAPAETSSVAVPRALSAGLTQGEVNASRPSHAQPAAAAAASATGPAICRISPPDPSSILRRMRTEPLQLIPADMLAIPVRLEGRLAAALLVTWDRPPGDACTAATTTTTTTTAAAATTATASPTKSTLQLKQYRKGHGASGIIAAGTGNGNGNENGNGNGGFIAGGGGEFGFELSPDVLTHLQQMAQFLVFGVMCESQQRRSLMEVAQRFALLPSANSLHDFVTGVMDAVTELLYIKFSVRLQPIFLLTHGLATGGPAVLFSPRSPHTHHQQHQYQPPGFQTGDHPAMTPLAPAGAGQATLRPNYLEAWSNSLGPGTGVPGSGSGGNVLQQSSSLAGLRPEDSANVVVGGDGPSRVRAVRISLHHTLLAEALRAASKIASVMPPVAITNTTTAGVPAQPRTNAGGKAADIGGMFIPTSIASSHHYVGQGIPSAINFPPPDSAATVDASIVNSAANGGGVAAVATGAPPLPAPPLIHTTIVPNTAAHFLEEGAPCRDLLLCSNLVQCGTTGSLVLAVEASPSTATSSTSFTGTAPPALTAASFLASVGGGGGSAASGPAGIRRANSMQTSVAATATSAVTPGGSRAAGALSALSQPLSLLHSQRQFGMYVVCPEVLPPGVLAAIAAELKQLLAMALSSCRDGALSVLSGGRCGWELYYLQELLLGLNSGTTTGGGGGGGGAGLVSLSLATAFAAASAISASSSLTPPLLLQSGALASVAAAAAAAAATSGQTPTQAALAAIGSSSAVGMREMLAASTPGSTPSPQVLFAAGPRAPLPPSTPGATGGRLLPRSFFALAAASCSLSGGGGIRSAGCLRLPPAHMQLAADVATEGSSMGRDLEQQLQESPAADGRLMTEGTGSGLGDQEGLRWLLASSPEVLLERPAAGPSPLEVMVSSMRTGLTAALTNAVVTDGGGDEARAALSLELAALRLYDVIGRGGQGVIFYGTLHGLETAVKVIVHRGKGEPLAHDGGDPRAGADGGGGEGGAGGGGGDGGGGGGAGAAAAGAPEEGGGGEGHGDLSRIRKAQRGALELVVTGALSHPNIVQVLASFSDVIMVRCTYRNEPTPRLRLVAKDDPILASWASPGPLNTVACLEYCDAGTLLEAAHAGAFRPPGSSVLSGSVRPALVPLYTSLLEVALALRYLHSRRLVHCDLKPANVLLKSSTRDPRGWTCKLSDFGCVRLMTELSVTAEDQQRPFLQPRGRTHGSATSAAAAGQSQSQQQHQQHYQHHQHHQQPTTVVGFRVAQPLGTIAYMAPESFMRGHTLGTSIDIYAFGILMYELLMCRAPYVGIDAQTLPRLVLRQHLRPEFHPLAPPEYCHLAARCWSSHVSRRPTAVQLVNEIEAMLADAQLKESRKAQRAAVVATATAANVGNIASALGGGGGGGGGGGDGDGGEARPSSSPSPLQQQQHLQGEGEAAVAVAISAQPQSRLPQLPQQLLLQQEQQELLLPIPDDCAAQQHQHRHHQPRHHQHRHHQQGSPLGNNSVATPLLQPAVVGSVLSTEAPSAAGEGGGRGGAKSFEVLQGQQQQQQQQQQTQSIQQHLQQELSASALFVPVATQPEVIVDEVGGAAVAVAAVAGECLDETIDVLQLQLPKHLPSLT